MNFQNFIQFLAICSLMLLCVRCHELHYTKEEIGQLLKDKLVYYNSLIRIQNPLSGH